MDRRIITFSIIPLIVVGTFFKGFDKDIDLTLYASTMDETTLDYSVEDKTITAEETLKISETCFATPLLDNSFVGFKEALAFKESTGNYYSVNTLGYLGKYQFGKNTLALIGIYNTQKFLNSPVLQEKAFIANAMRNKWILRREINRFVGSYIDGILVTESGILAAAHLAGPGSVKKYLRSYGAIGFTDAYGTTIQYYMKRFSGFDTSFVKPDRQIKASLL